MIRGQAASFALKLEEVRTSLQQAIDDKCDVIDRQQTELLQINTTLQMFIETQATSNSEQDVIAANLTTLLARFPRECVSISTMCICASSCMPSYLARL